VRPADGARREGRALLTLLPLALRAHGPGAHPPRRCFRWAGPPGAAGSRPPSARELFHWRPLVSGVRRDEPAAGCVPLPGRLPHCAAKRGKQVESWTAALKQACKTAGVTRDLRYHDLRRAVVTRLQREGAPPGIITMVTGHKTIATQSRYTVCSRDDLALYLGKVSEQLTAKAMKVA